MRGDGPGLDGRRRHCLAPRGSRRHPPQAPLAYTPPYLAEKILTSRSALEGERKQVTVLFADLKGSTELIRDLDPEDAQQLLDPGAAAHDGRGTPLSKAPSTRCWAMALWRSLAPRSPTKIMPSGPVTRPWPCRRRCAAMRRRCAARMAWRCRSASGSTPAKSWCAPLATTCTWTTRPWGRPRTWPRAWSNSPRRAASG